MRLIATLATAAFLTLPLSASASPSFPAAVKTDLSLTYTPDCTICHSSDSGGVGTVVQPFGKAMRAQGLVLENTGSLQSALAAVAADSSIDSDCDGVNDVQELKDGRNPNTGDYIDGSGKTNTATGCSGVDGGSQNGGTSIDTPTYGCGANVAPAPVSAAGASGLVTLLGLAALSMRRGRRRRSR